jgi:hypothetical protein
MIGRPDPNWLRNRNTLDSLGFGSNSTTPVLIPSNSTEFQRLKEDEKLEASVTMVLPKSRCPM